MFSDRVVNNPFTKRFCEGIVRHERKEFDNSMISTMRSVLISRAGKDIYSLWEYKRTNYALEIDDNVSGSKILRLPGYDCWTFDCFLSWCAPKESKEVFLHTFRIADEFRDEVISRLMAAECPSGWKIIPKVTQFFERTFPVIALANEEKKSSVVILFSDNLRHYHAVQAAILAWMPYVFDKEKGITDNEKALFESLQNGDFEAYNDALDGIAADNNVKDRILEDALSSMENRKLDAEIGGCEREINDYHLRIDTWMEKIADATSRIRELQARIVGLRMAVKENSGNELLEFFRANRQVELHEYTNEKVYFNVFGTLQFWDEDQAERYIENENSFLYANIPAETRYVSKKDMYYLLRAIFIDYEVKIRVCARYYINTNGAVGSVSNASFDDTYSEYMMNPHIQGYSCMGENADIVTNAIRNGDYVTAVQQCIVSGQSLNIGDSTVMIRFINEMYSATKRFIELPDGRFVTPYEAVEYLKETGYIPAEEKEDEQNGEND